MIPKPSYKKRKPEPVQKIKMQDEYVCWNCGNRHNLERHHAIYGTGNRQIAERYNLVVWLCIDCHTGNNGVHFNKRLDNSLKMSAQHEFEQIYNRETFVREFGRNYLD